MIYSRIDGTYIINKNNLPYHVLKSDIINWEDVQKRIADGEDVKNETPLAPEENMQWNEEFSEWEYKTDFFIDPNKLSKGFTNIDNEALKRISEGFIYNSNNFQTTPEFQALVNKYLIEHLLGVNIFPFEWITDNNVKIEITDISILTGLKNKMYTHISTCREEAFLVKQNILNSSTAIEAKDFYTSYMGI